MEGIGLRLNFDCRLSIFDLRSASRCGGSLIPCPRSGLLDPQPQIGIRQLAGRSLIKVLKMKIALDELLKTKGKIRCSG